MYLDLKHKGVLENSISLEIGEHTIGRAESCQIVLAEKRVSRRHAKLIITEKGWLVEELSNVNGTYVNDQKISGLKPLTDRDVVRIGNYTLSQVREAKSQRLKQGLAVHLEHVLASLSSHPLLIPIVLVTVSSLSAIVIFALLSGSYLKDSHLQWEKERARMLAAALAANNQATLLTQTDLSKLEIGFFEKQPGVTSVYLVDLHGRILAPIDQMNKAMKVSVVSDSLKSGTEMEQITEEGNLIVSHPVRVEGQIKGAAVLLYRFRNTSGLLGNRTFQLIGVLTVVSIMSIACGIFIYRILLFPWVRMRHAVEEAITNQKTMIESPVTFPEIEAHKVQIDRLLLRAIDKIENEEGDSPRQGLNTRNGQVQPKISDGSTPGGSPANWFDQNEIALCIDRRSNMVVKYSPNFLNFFEQVDDKQRHILDVFNDPVVLTKVNELLCHGEGETIVPILDRSYTASVVGYGQESNLAKVTFAEI